MDKNTNDIIDSLAFIRDHMAAKDDITALRGELDLFRAETAINFQSLRAELIDIRERLDALEESVGNMKGYAREIDELRARTNAIEQHLGLDRRIAA